MSAETDILTNRAAAELKTAGAPEIYVFGSAAKGTGDTATLLEYPSGRKRTARFRPWQFAANED